MYQNFMYDDRFTCKLRKNILCCMLHTYCWFFINKRQSFPSLVVLMMDSRALHKQDMCSVTGQHATPFPGLHSHAKYTDPKLSYRDSLMDEAFYLTSRQNQQHSLLCLLLLCHFFGIHLAIVYGSMIHLVCSCLSSLTSMQTPWVHMVLSKCF